MHRRHAACATRTAPQPPPAAQPPSGFTQTVFPTNAHLNGTGATYDSTQTFAVVANTGLILVSFQKLSAPRCLLPDWEGSSQGGGGGAVHVLPGLGRA